MLRAEHLAKYIRESDMTVTVAGLPPSFGPDVL